MTRRPPAPGPALAPVAAAMNPDRVASLSTVAGMAERGA